jgi:hypothetical protein
MNAPSKFWIHTCSKIMNSRNNCASRLVPLVHCTMCTQIAPAAINTGVRSNPKVPFTFVVVSALLTHTNAISCDLVNHCLGFFPLTPMATSHPEMFQKSTADESSEIQKLLRNHFLPEQEVLRWRPANGEDIPTSNTNEIVALFSFF